MKYKDMTPKQKKKISLKCMEWAKNNKAKVKKIQQRYFSKPEVKLKNKIRHVFNAPQSKIYQKIRYEQKRELYKQYFIEYYNQHKKMYSANRQTYFYKTDRLISVYYRKDNNLEILKVRGLYTAIEKMIELMDNGNMVVGINSKRIRLFHRAEINKMYEGIKFNQKFKPIKKLIDFYANPKLKRVFAK